MSQAVIPGLAACRPSFGWLRRTNDPWTTKSRQEGLKPFLPGLRSVSLTWAAQCAADAEAGPGAVAAVSATFRFVPSSALP